MCKAKYSYTFHGMLYRKRLKTGPRRNAVRSQKNSAISKVNKKFNSHLTRVKRAPSVAAAVHVSHALAAVRFSCLLQGRGASSQDGVAAGKGFRCAPF
jgi:hypothetical protein